MEPSKKCEMTRKAMVGAIGLWVGFVIARSAPEVVRYLRLVRS
jgi:hypothetical protein